MAEVLFFIAGIGAIAGAIGVVALRNPFYAVLALVGHLISLAALFLLLQAFFVAAAQVVVYAGAVMVLYVFVVAYVGGSDEPVRPAGGPALRTVSIIFASALFVELCIAILGSGLRSLGEDGARVQAGFGSPAEMGELFLTRFLLPFEAASFLLLIAAVGAVVLARRRGGLEPVTGAERPLVPERRPLGTGTMREAVSGQVGTPAEIGELRPPEPGAPAHAASPRGEDQEGGW